MKKHTSSEAILLLEDGTVYKGKSLGRIGTSGGELCFNTGMTGYQEIFTDPSYYGQLVVTTVSHVGNYGVQPNEVESGRVQISGLVCKDFSNHFSRKTAEGSLQEYFEKAGIVGICEIDTRSLVRHIRDKGAMNAIVSSEITDVEELRKKLNAVPSMNGLELSSHVSTTTEYDLKPEVPKYRVAVLDLGVKRNSLNNFMQRGCEVKVFPYNTSFEEMEKWNPDGYFISNGPGDPAATKDAVASVKQILQQEIPMFGICMGHQILAQANGIATYKMHNGHRGLNHPVKNLLTGRSEITSQNHGFVVDAEQLKNHPEVEITHINLNDNTVEGMRMKTKPAFSVQFHPESSPGPHDSTYLFDEFVALLEQSKNKV
ncbi:glutamine-hydrolyzing carbamoyl-phosphate synthase small subunit [Pontibacter akesuensis]|uniref:Carbamoyl phosphate synthase small chain n=1 Tax=Pontibacter akesuensis TaxID=388950 RepID=A0A1I7JHB8_9BACT|nr:glutamine-hydrolyzing carbamoyl-phosphate synthase small subunit [Pontibacter akesuensis]GHA69984.1 carbamoyl-phosphate synthase small chain [Pontibacter akesuensis]SFU84556.1 carbamoyl-phosphate synthase small subunit [Pontibacter akesuensis]